MIDLPRDRWTLVELLRRQAERYGERPFVRTLDGAALSFAELDRRSTAVAHALSGLGVEPRDRVLALMTNSLEFLVAQLATNKRNAIFVPVNTELKGAFLEHQLRTAAPRIVIVDEALARAFEGVDVSVANVETVIVVGAGGAPAFAGKRVLRFDDLQASRERGEIQQPKPSDVSTVIWTSGTTGPSKGVLMPHAHCVLMGWTLAERMPLREDDVYYVCMPFFHANALFMQIVGCLVAGAQAVIVRRFSASSWLEDVRRSGATVTNALGVMPEFIYRQPPTPHDRDHRLRAMMAVPIAKEWGQAFVDRFGARIVQGFGLSESNIIAYTRLDDPVEAGCCGEILDEWFEVKVVDPATDDEVPRGERGEIVIRPKRPWCFMAGYLNMPDKTVEAWRNLWFHTGDAGRFDEKGRLFFLDRIKDSIRRRGENISSFEVEQVLNAHPAVAESAVVAVKATDGGGEDEVKACVTLRSGEPLSAEALLDWCQERMPRYAVPRYVEFSAELPKTPTGKLRKEELRSRGITPDTWDRESIGYVIRR